MVYHQRLRYLKVLHDRASGIERNKSPSVYSRINPSFFDQTTDDEKDTDDNENEKFQPTSTQPPEETRDDSEETSSEKVKEPETKILDPEPMQEMNSTFNISMDVMTTDSKIVSTEPFDPLSLLASATKRPSISIDVKSIIAMEEELGENSEESGKIDPLVDTKHFNDLLNLQRNKINTVTTSRPSLLFARKKTTEEIAEESFESLQKSQPKLVDMTSSNDSKIALKPLTLLATPRILKEPEVKLSLLKTKPKPKLEDEDEEAVFEPVTPKQKSEKANAMTLEIPKESATKPVFTDKTTIAETPKSIKVEAVASAYDDYDFTYDQPQNANNGHDSDEDSLDRFFATPAHFEEDEDRHHGQSFSSKSSSLKSNVSNKTPSKRPYVDIDDEDFLDAENDYYGTPGRKTLGKASRSSSITGYGGNSSSSSSKGSSSSSSSKHDGYGNKFESSKRSRYVNENPAEVALRNTPIAKRDLEWDDGNQGNQQFSNGYNGLDGQFNGENNDGSNVNMSEQVPPVTFPVRPAAPLPPPTPKPVQLKTNKFFSKPKVQQMAIKPMEAIPTGQLFYCINKFQLLPTKPTTALSRLQVDEKPLLSKSLHLIQELQLKSNDLKIFHKFSPDIFDRYATGCIVALKANGSDTRRLLVVDSKLKTIFQDYNQQQATIQTPVVDLCDVSEDPLKAITIDTLDDKPITAEEFENLKLNISPTILPIYNENFVNQKIMEMRFCRKFVSKMII